MLAVSSVLFKVKVLSVNFKVIKTVIPTFNNNATAGIEWFTIFDRRSSLSILRNTIHKSNITALLFRQVSCLNIKGYVPLRVRRYLYRGDSGPIMPLVSYRA